MSLRPEPLPRRSANIFINYRREDSAGYSGRLFDRLSGRFPERVFMDIDTIEPGIDFFDVIEEAVGCCEVLIVVIGREWLFLTDSTGRRRLDDPNDFVRLEIAAALDRNIRIIPVLVGDAAMPRPEDLPPDLGKLTRRNAIELSDVRWAFDVDRLIQAIEMVLQEKAPSALFPVVKAPVMPASAEPAPVREKARPRAWMAAAVLALLTLPPGWIVLANQLNLRTKGVTSAPGPVAPATLPQQEATGEKEAQEEVTPEKVTQEKAASKAGPSRWDRMKGGVKSFWGRAKRGSGEKAGDQGEGGAKQGG